MKKGGKIAVITAALLLTGVAAYALFKKPKAPPKKKLVTTVSTDNPVIVDENFSGTLKPGSSGRYVEQLQQALNDLHNAVLYINKNCSMQWPSFGSYGNNPLPVSGSYDAKTALASQFYLNRTEVDLDYLRMIQDKIDKYRAGDKCKHPLSY